MSTFTTASGIFVLCAAAALSGCASSEPSDSAVTVVTAREIDALSVGARLRLGVDKSYRFESSAGRIDYSRVDVTDGTTTIPLDAFVDEEARLSSVPREFSVGAFDAERSTESNGIAPKRVYIRICLPIVMCAFYDNGAYAGCKAIKQCTGYWQ